MSAIKKSKGLGRGLEALLGPTVKDEPAEGGEMVQQMPVKLVQAGKYQPRSRMDESALAELADSIRSQGVMQPILVRSIAANKYEIIAGERRFRASQLAGLTEVPVIVRKVADEAALVMALIENIQREDLNPLEEAQGLSRLIKEFGLTHEQAASAVGKSRSATSNLLRLLALAPPVQTMLLAGDLEMGHARALLALVAGDQVGAAHEVINRRLSVRDTERLVALRLTQAEKTRPRAQVTSVDITRLQDRLADWMAAAVHLKSNSKGAGQITVKFGSLDELDGILAKWRFSDEEE
ncbi:MAG: ParB/RepB/Spo0J family partition protein [Burkholderiales bacterium]|jgi:ParB family chromosome partitioning protein|nr:ParB/RepB/Spo0J family partition protein [Burkholderiales bacterium]